MTKYIIFYDPKDLEDKYYYYAKFINNKCTEAAKNCWQRSITPLLFTLEDMRSEHALQDFRRFGRIYESTTPPTPENNPELFI